MNIAVRHALAADGTFSLGQGSVPACDGRYLVPQPRNEPFDVTYRCALDEGHEGPHRGQP
jgi:hypothetical protein